MPKIKSLSASEILAKKMKDKDFAKEYEASEEEFALAREVIKLRIGANMTQTELAKRVGTSQPAIARLESGSYKNLTLSFLRRVGGALGVQPEVHFQKIAS